MDESSLYPDIEPYQSGWLKVDDLHEIYWEESGNPAGVPIILLHGGPGSGCRPWHRRLFDPSHYRIILFDQRGAGNSRPLGETRANTPDLLVSDMEALRIHMGIEKWIPCGGSWGSTLGLLYAETHPERCIALVVRGIFTMRKSELDWLYGHVGTIFPDAWHEFTTLLPEHERASPVSAYLARLMSEDPAVHLPAMRAWNALEDSCATLLPPVPPQAKMTDDERAHALARARIEAFYFVYHGFTPDDHILRNAHKLAGIPGIIIQGRYDMICPFTTAWELSRAWPNARFIIVPDAGHSISHDGIRMALMRGMEDLRKLC
ncbi:MAG TPA: prolyl aminopeptidase [Rhodospirillaceae bacterium]|nr:MAG: prolyl aminopeptidase [Alphaproteobacteria bacterium GWF2_58_20]HAU29407.1 prolyl aminopeptidase [Rhodospirillaceae bacterium]